MEQFRGLGRFWSEFWLESAPEITRSMARLSSTSQTFLHRRSDTGQYVYMRDVKVSVAILVVGEVERPWTAKPFQLTGRSNIKISLKTTDPRIANERWLAVHPQIEDLVLSAEEGLRKAAHERKPPTRRKMKVVPALTQADRAAIAEQVRHDILADDWHTSRRSMDRKCCGCDSALTVCLPRIDDFEAGGYERAGIA
jgi:hypothetical protein